MAQKKLTKKQIDILYECWKNSETTKDRITLIEKNLPLVPSLAALGVMRKMEKTDPKWLKMSTRKKNKKEQEKINKQREKENRKIEIETKRTERESKRIEREKLNLEKNKLNNIRTNLKEKHFDKITEIIGNNFLFCSKIQQYVSSVSCIFKLFSDECAFMKLASCEKCLKFHKHIPIIEEMLKDETKKKLIRNKTSERGSKNPK